MTFMVMKLLRFKRAFLTERSDDFRVEKKKPGDTTQSQSLPPEIEEELLSRQYKTCYMPYDDRPF